MGRRVVTILATAVASSALTACGLLGDPTATLVIPKTIVAGAKTQVEGAYSEEKPGLEVQIHSKSSKRPLATSSTDREGRFQAELEVTEAGTQSFSVSISDGDQITRSPYKIVNVLEKSSVSMSLVGGREASVGDKRSVKGKVEPGAGPEQCTWSHRSTGGHGTHGSDQGASGSVYAQHSPCSLAFSLRPCPPPTTTANPKPLSIDAAPSRSSTSRGR